MPKGIRDWSKYQETRKLNGSLALKDPKQESIVTLTLSDTPKEDIMKLLELSEAQVDTMLADPLVKKRLAYKVGQAEQANPKTSDEYLDFAGSELVKLSLNAENEKTKIDALEAIVSMAIKVAGAGKKANGDEPPVSNQLLQSLDKTEGNK